MKKYTEMTPQERQAEYAAVKAKFEQLKGMGLSLNMARGKPGKVQLDLATPIFGLLTKPEDLSPTASTSATTARWRVSPRPEGCSRTFWAASPSRCSWAATPACN